MIVNMVKLIWVMLWSFIGLSIAADWPAEKVKIDRLIMAIEVSELKFERNGKVHTSKEAAQHLRMKLKNALNSWFSPATEKWTAELFIEKVASGSSLTGKAYVIITKENRRVLSRDWLKAKLLKMDKGKEKQ